MFLLEAGYKVRVAVRNDKGPAKIKAFKSTAAYESQIEYITVPDITVSGAYDDAVKGAKYVVHVASPFAAPDLMESEFESSYIQPAIKGSVGMLESAAKVEGIQRVVITGSSLSIAGFAVAGTNAVVDGMSYPAHREFCEYLTMILQRLTAALSLLDRTPTGLQHTLLPKLWLLKLLKSGWPSISHHSILLPSSQCLYSAVMTPPQR